jgi:hypothetical protein
LRRRNRQELDDLRLERERHAVPEDTTAGQIDGEVAERDRRQALGGHLLEPAEERPDAGGELAQAEGLRHVVVGAELQPDDLVDLRALRGQHDDRDARFLAHDPADLDAAELRQHQVEHDEVRALLAESLQRLPPVGGGHDPEAVGLQRLGQRFAESCLVVDDEDRASHRSQDRRRG